MEEEGYTADSVVGKSGLEQSMDAVLQGKNGSKTVYVDNMGRLLSEEEPAPEPETPPRQTQTAAAPSWVDALPGTIGRLARRWGWLAGVYVALVGLAIAVIGGLARYIAGRMFSGIQGTLDTFMGNALQGYDIVYQTGDMMGQFAANNPVSIMGTAMLVIGLLVMAAGIILALVLKKKSRDWENRDK